MELRSRNRWAVLPAVDPDESPIPPRYVPCTRPPKSASRCSPDLTRARVRLNSCVSSSRMSRCRATVCMRASPAPRTALPIASFTSDSLCSNASSSATLPPSISEGLSPCRTASPTPWPTLEKDTSLTSSSLSSLRASLRSSSHSRSTPRICERLEVAGSAAGLVTSDEWALGPEALIAVSERTLSICLPPVANWKRTETDELGWYTQSCHSIQCWILIRACDTWVPPEFFLLVSEDLGEPRKPLDINCL
mmetsp:Transcript_13739/g.26357  ORF Transcript_13739/g.26357 Transcript_13739/m.26357 type:complete len:250 (-) Transcript_13739:186-935(-)